MCDSELQCVAVCGSVSENAYTQCSRQPTLNCSWLQCVAVSCSVSCSVWQRVAVWVRKRKHSALDNQLWILSNELIIKIQRCGECAHLTSYLCATYLHTIHGKFHNTLFVREHTQYQPLYMIHPHTNESCHTCHTCTRHRYTYEWVMSHMPHMHTTSCVTFEWVMSHMPHMCGMCDMTHSNESCHTCHTWAHTTSYLYATRPHTFHGKVHSNGSYVWHDSFDAWDHSHTTHQHTHTASFIIQPFYMWDMTRSHVWQDSLTCVTWLTQDSSKYLTRKLWSLSHFTCDIWLIYMCSVNHTSLI